jgi:hypothetical protein
VSLGKLSRERIGAGAGPVALAALFVALAAASWGRWADPLVDFGREPYLARQLLDGRVLYRDVDSLFGPLSPWVNALWFGLFGASLRTLAFSNLALAALLAVVVYRFCLACADRTTATVATTVLLVSFLFAHHAEDAANYNFVWPYTHSATHGTILLVCGVALLCRAVVSDRSWAWVGAGTLLGGTVLTKPEIALAAAVTASVAAAWRLLDGRRGPANGLALLTAGAVAPLVVCDVLLGHEALLFQWRAAWKVGSQGSSFYASLMGSDDLARNGLRLAVDAIVWTTFAAVLVILDVRAVGAPASSRRRMIMAAIGVVGAWMVRDLPGVGRALPLLLPLAVIATGYLAHRRRMETERALCLILWATAAWTLLLKMLLNVHFHHYGFFLAMPATIFVVVFGVGTVPHLLSERTAGGGWLVRPVALTAIGLLLAYSAALSTLSYGNMTVPIGRDENGMRGPGPLASPTGELAATLERRIETTVPSDATIAIMPEGALLNFLTGRSNPTPHYSLEPPELAALGIEAVVARYQESPPDYVVVIAWSGDEYGVGPFGGPGWGADLVRWVERDYDRVELRTSTPTELGFSIWQRREARHITPRG